MVLFPCKTLTEHVSGSEAHDAPHVPVLHCTSVGIFEYFLSVLPRRY